jgi:hypothetical protein
LRPALLRCLKALQDGDTLLVWKLDRLGRSLRDLIAVLDDLRERGVKFRSLTEQIDTGKIHWHRTTYGSASLFRLGREGADSLTISGARHVAHSRHTPLYSRSGWRSLSLLSRRN